MKAISSKIDQTEQRISEFERRLLKNTQRTKINTKNNEEE
jgi:hypothetical protein